MNLNNMMNSILKIGSSISVKKGKELFRNSLTTKISAKKINDIYHIYGRVIDNVNECRTHIKFSLDDKVIKVRCTCDKYETNSKEIRDYVCPHIIATMYNFYYKVNKKIEKNKASKEVSIENKLANNINLDIKDNNNLYKSINNKNNITLHNTYDNSLEQKKLVNISNNKVEGFNNSNIHEYDKYINLNINNYSNLMIKKDKKISNTNLSIDRTNKEEIKNNISTIKKENISAVKLEIKIKQVKITGNNEYYIELRIGKENTIAVESIGKLLFIDDNKFKYRDFKIIEFLREKAKDDKSRIVNSRYFKIYENELRDFLSLIDNKKTITITYDYMNYLSIINKENIPLIFTIKKRDNFIIVKAQKKSIIPLSNNKDVWIYDKKIYIPSKKQVKYYKDIYKELLIKDSLTYKYTEENLKRLLIILGEIAGDIIIDESIKEDVNSINKPKFYFYKKENFIYCDLKIDYANKLKGIKDSRSLEKLEMLLERYKFIKKDENFIFIGNEEEEYIFLKEGLVFLRSQGKVLLDKTFKINRIINSKDIISYLKEKNDGIYFSYEIEELDYEELGYAYDEYKKGRNFYKTRNNNFLDLRDNGVREFLLTIEELNFLYNVHKKEVYVDKFNLLHLENKITNNKIPYINGSEVINSIFDKLKGKRDREYRIPETLKASLRDYQKKGYSWLRTIEELGLGAILADDMGLGKTIQTITLLLSKPEKKSLIITPTVVLYNWKSEFEKFAPSLKVGIIHGSLKERRNIINNYNDYDVLLTTYGTFKRDLELYEGIVFDFCIIDEAQNIKNKSAKVTKAVKEIKANCKIALTGTPIENNLLELWSIFDFIMPQYLFSEEKFKEKFIKGTEKELLELKNMISPFILRRLKEEVLEELPEKIEKEYIVPMSAKQKQLYTRYLKEVKKKLKEDKHNKVVIFSYLTKLRQLCLDPSILIDDFKEGSSKIKAVFEIVKESLEANKKIIIFSQFTSVLKKIGGKLEEDEVKYLYLDGSTKAKDRITLVNEFNNQDKHIFLISLKAGGVGLNLTAANIVIHFDPWWNPAVEDQATDRAYRIGQKNIVEVIKLIAKDTIEEKIVALQENKKELINKIIDENLLTGDKLNLIEEEELLNLFI